MKSTSGVHYPALDHVRAFAAWQVFVWHFVHSRGRLVPFDYVPDAIPLSLLEEGHTGVSLFMCLSGYLFAKLLDGKSISYPLFIWNRVIRLLPLLVVVILLYRFRHGSEPGFWQSVARGWYAPTLPNGGWSITVEFHFYVLLPLFLWLLRLSRLLPLVVVFAAIALRMFLYEHGDDVQWRAYWTLVGRVDQFTCGMLAWHFRRLIAGRHLVAGALVLSFMAFYWQFNRMGGYDTAPGSFWILLPTIEGLSYAGAVAWYDNSFQPANGWMSRFIGHIGELSYSIYLLHFFVVFGAARFIQQHVMDISHFSAALPWAAVVFLLLLIPAELSYRFIEKPFLKFRRRYTRDKPRQPSHEKSIPACA